MPEDQRHPRFEWNDERLWPQFERLADADPDALALTDCSDRLWSRAELRARCRDCGGARRGWSRARRARARHRPQDGRNDRDRACCFIPPGHILSGLAQARNGRPGPTRISARPCGKGERPGGCHARNRRRPWRAIERSPRPRHRSHRLHVGKHRRSQGRDACGRRAPYAGSGRTTAASICQRCSIISRSRVFPARNGRNIWCWWTPWPSPLSASSTKKAMAAIAVEHVMGGRPA